MKYLDLPPFDSNEMAIYYLGLTHCTYSTKQFMVFLNREGINIKCGIIFKTDKCVG